MVLIAAGAGQDVGPVRFGGELNGFFGAVAMTPLALGFDHLPNGPPMVVTFLPAFGVLVPGAVGLIRIAGIGRIAGIDREIGANSLCTDAHRSLDATTQEVRRFIIPEGGK